MMKLLKAKHEKLKTFPKLKKQIFQISNLAYIKYYEQHGVYNLGTDKGFEMVDPILVNKHTVSEVSRYGANGNKYFEKEYSVVRGNQRVTLAKKLGYTHIEGVLLPE